MLYEKVQHMTTWTGSASNAVLRQRIMNSLEPERMMVFLLDLQQTGAT